MNVFARLVYFIQLNSLQYYLKRKRLPDAFRLSKSIKQKDERALQRYLKGL